MKRNTNTVALPSILPLLALPVVGYAADNAQYEALLKLGIPDAMVYRLGRGAETLDAAIEKFRGRIGTLVISSLGRVFGTSKKMVMEAFEKIEIARIRVVDLERREIKTLSKHTDRALALVAGASRMKSNRRAKRIGARGGEAKGAAAASRRNAAVDDEIAKRICSHPKLNWKDRAVILGMPESTVIRHYR